MWDQNLFELFTNIIPQAFIFVFLFFVLTNIPIKKRTYPIFSIIFALITFIVRKYVNFGVHSIITMLLLIFIGAIWCKTNVITSIIYSIVTFAIAYLSEWFTFMLLGFVNFDMNKLNTNPQLRTIIGLIPLAIFFSVSLITFFVKKRFKKKEDNENDVVRADFK